MSTQEVITEIQSMSLKERLTIIEATLNLITNDINLLGKSNKELDYIEKVRQRRRSFLQGRLQQSLLLRRMLPQTIRPPAFGIQ